LLISTGGFLTQIKTDGIGFQFISPADLPQVQHLQPDSGIPLRQSMTDNSTDPQRHGGPSEDPLYDFLARRKKFRLQFERRYSKKALALQAYQKQKDDNESGSSKVNGILLDNFQD
jgi:hypothetical protein